jgi:hypothetical protein
MTQVWILIGNLQKKEKKKKERKKERKLFLGD